MQHKLIRNEALKRRFVSDTSS